MAERRHLLALGLILCLFAGFFLLVLQGLSPVAGDESHYFAMAREWASGRWPYRDFFHAHPPLHLLPLALVDRVFGPSLLAMKLVSPVAVAASALLLGALARTTLGLGGAVISVALYLFSSGALNATTMANGSELATFWALLGVFLSLRGSRWAAGVALAASTGTALYALGIVLPWLLMGAFRDSSGRKRLLAYSLASVAVYLPFLLVAPWAVLDQVVLYHLDKPRIGGGWVVWPEVFFHAHLWVGAAVAPFVSRWAWLALPMIVGVTLQCTALRQLAPYYFYPALPFLAFASAAAVVGTGSLFARAKWPALAALGALCLWLPLESWTFRQAFPETSDMTYEWVDPPVYPWLGAITQALFWRSSRLEGEIHPAFRYYLWRTTRRFSTLGEVAEFVRQGSTPDETLVGHPDVVAQVSLASGRRVSGGLIDVSSNRWSAGRLDEHTFWRRVCSDHPRFLVVRDGGILPPSDHFTTEWAAQDRVARRFFRPVKRFRETHLHYGRPLEISIYEVSRGGCDAPPP